MWTLRTTMVQVQLPVMQWDKICALIHRTRIDTLTRVCTWVQTSTYLQKKFPEDGIKCAVRWWTVLNVPETCTLKHLSNHTHFLTSGSLILLMGLRACACRQPLHCEQLWPPQAEDCTWRLIVKSRVPGQKNGFGFAPKRLCTLTAAWRTAAACWATTCVSISIPKVCPKQLSCLQLTLATKWLRGSQAILDTTDTLYMCQGHVVEESFIFSRVCKSKIQLLSFLSPSTFQVLLFFQQHPVLTRREWSNPTSAEKMLRVQLAERKRPSG